MKKQLLSATAALLLLASCSSDSKDGTVNPPSGGNTSSVVEITGDISSSRTLSADSIYLLRGNVFVTNNATLTIQPGTLIKGDKATKAALIITRGAKIDAKGTSDKPIVFTSNQAAGARDRGDWGGVILLGKAPNNLGTSVSIEGISYASDKAKHGGTEAGDNSGTMQYVRIEFAGIALSPDNEINGLTFGSVGSGTTIDHIEVYRSGDDSYEWFGGTVNAKYLLAIATWDDDFDTDNGFSGHIQFGLAQRLANTADVSGSNGFESDNNADGNNGTPQTSAVFSNMTIIGPIDVAGAKNVSASYQHAVQIRRNSAISIFNSVFAGYTEGIYYDDGLGTAPNIASTNLLSGKSVFQNNLVLGSNSKNNQIKASPEAVLSNIQAYLTSTSAGNVFDANSYAASVITDPYKYAGDLATSGKNGVPNFTVKAGSAAATGAKFDNAKLATGFDHVDYKGAFGTEDWSAGWASYDPQTLPYDKPGAVK